MCKKGWIFLFIGSILLRAHAAPQGTAGGGSPGETFSASTNEEVYGAVKRLKPGDTLLLEDGAYNGLNLIVTCSGEAGSPITIKAANPGAVFITGDARVELRGQHLILKGLFFKDGDRDVTQWKPHGPGLVAIYGSHNRVTGCVFDCFDTVNSAYITTSLTEDGEVPQYCRIDHCVFTDKITFDQVINLNNTVKPIKDGSAGGPPMYHRIDHNFFSNPKKPGNAGGGIRIGYYRNDLGRCLIDSNVFMRQDSEPEIITSKSRENVFYQNTFINCRGTLNFRHGDRQVAIHNFFVGTDTQYEYGGMFVWGSEHVIACNYFDLPTTIQSRGNAALYLNPGPANTEHALAFNSLIANNAFVNINGHAIHFNPLEDRRKAFAQRLNLKYETPHHMIIKGNIFFSDGHQGYTFILDDYQDTSNRWENNIAFGGKLGRTPPKGIVKGYLYDTKDAYGIYRLSSKSRYVPTVVSGIRPIEGINLHLDSLVSHGITGVPLSWEDVRPHWLKEIPGTYAHTGKLSSEREAKFQSVIGLKSHDNDSAPSQEPSQE